MFAKVVVPIAPDATSPEVEHDLALAGGALLVDVIERMAAGTAREEPQDDARATYASKVTREEGEIDWTKPAVAIHNQIRGLTPWPHAWTHLDGARLILVSGAPEPSADAAAPPGTIVEARGDALRVATGSGTLRVLLLQPEGRRAMSPREFLAGRHLGAGARLT